MANFSPGIKYEIAREESWENQAAILFSAFQAGLKILARFGQTGLEFSARAEILQVIRPLEKKQFPCQRNLMDMQPLFLSKLPEFNQTHLHLHRPRKLQLQPPNLPCKLQIDTRLNHEYLCWKAFI